MIAMVLVGMADQTPTSQSTTGVIILVQDGLDLITILRRLIVRPGRTGRDGISEIRTGKRSKRQFTSPTEVSFLSSSLS